MSVKLKAICSVACLAAISSYGTAQDRSTITDYLRSALVGQTVTLRTFDKGERLEFDTEGVFLLRAAPASWTTSSKLHVEKVEVKQKEILIRGKRAIVVFDNDQKMRLVSTKNEREILIHFLNSTIDQSSADSAIRHVFLAPGEHLSAIVPPYWQQFVSKNVEGLAAPLPAASPSATTDHPTDAQPLSPNTHPTIESLLAMARKGAVTSPKAIYWPDPEYTEEARSLKLGGKVVLMITVGTDGRAHEPRIQYALGAGLDDSSVDAIKTWRFQPATKNGQPIPFQTSIETSFEMY